MPYKNRCKILAVGCYYHIYGRGVNKMSIFEGKDDYKLYCYLLKKYLTPDFKEIKIVSGQKLEMPVNSVSDKVELCAFCFMTNHFHMLLKNLEKDGIRKLMTRVLTVYSRYFNEKYDRQGPLIQGNYRAVNVSSEEQFVHVSRYIHLNPIVSGLVKKAVDYEYSSYNNYLEKKGNAWLKLDPCLLRSTEYENIEKYSKDIKENSKDGIII